MEKGFTLIELLVVIAIIIILSGIILFSVTQYVSRGKDSNIAGNLAVLIPAGEIFYNSYGNSYVGFCGSSAVSNAVLQMPPNTAHQCKDTADAWAACAIKFSDRNSAYCVDSRGVKRDDMSSSSCVVGFSLTQCP